LFPFDEKGEGEMRWFMVMLVAVILLTAGTPSMTEEPKSVATAQPSVVKTVPQCGEIRVDPATTEIRVTFSKDMRDNRETGVRSISLTSKQEGVLYGSV
jgi:hypothetical protein